MGILIANRGSDRFWGGADSLAPDVLLPSAPITRHIVVGLCSSEEANLSAASPRESRKITFFTVILTLPLGGGFRGGSLKKFSHVALHFGSSRSSFRKTVLARKWSELGPPTSDPEAEHPVLDRESVLLRRITAVFFDVIKPSTYSWQTCGKSKVERLQFLSTEVSQYGALSHHRRTVAAPAHLFFSNQQQHFLQMGKPSRSSSCRQRRRSQLFRTYTRRVELQR